MENKLDILLMCDNGLETVGGEQESTKIIIEGIKDLFSVGVIQPGKVERPQLGVEYYYLTTYTRIKHLVKHPVFFIKYILRVRKIIVNRKPKIIHTQSQVSFFIVALLKKMKLIPQNSYIVHTERGLYTKYSGFIKQVFYFFMRELDVLVTTTNLNMKYWKNAIQNKGLSLEFEVIENTAGYIFESYEPKLKKRDSDCLVIGFAGRYCDWKNWPLAVDISKELNEILGDKLRVKMAVGCLDSKALDKTQKMFDDLNSVFGDRFDGKTNIDIYEMDKFYYDIDIFILTSNYNTESFGRTLVEAMSRKNVVLTTDAGGSVEVVGNDENVCHSKEEFVKRIMYLYNNKKLMTIEKRNNFERVKEEYSLSNNLEKHKNLYYTLMSYNEQI